MMRLVDDHDIVVQSRQKRAFAPFDMGVIGAGGLAPIAYGVIADHSSRTVGIVASALTAAAIIPMALRLFLHEGRSETVER